jgi:S1-C subfamily serine protease
LINPLASRDARRWAVRSELIEGVLGADGFVVTDPRLTRGLGIEAGDTIVSVGGRPPRGLLAVLSAVQRDPDRATVLVEIDRGGTRLVHSYRVR